MKVVNSIWSVMKFMFGSKRKIIASVTLIIIIGTFQGHLLRRSWEVKVVDVLPFSSPTADVNSNEKPSYKTERSYLISTIDKKNNPHVFRNEDSVIELKWNSSNYIALLEKGTWVKIDAYGFRSTFFSWFPNITDVTKLKTVTKKGGM